MCSLNPADWIKICEMLLGPAPADFEFEPKVTISSLSLLCASDAVDCFALGGPAVRNASRGVICNTPTRCMTSPPYGRSFSLPSVAMHV